MKPDALPFFFNRPPHRSAVWTRLSRVRSVAAWFLSDPNWVLCWNDATMYVFCFFFFAVATCCSLCENLIWAIDHEPKSETSLVADCHGMFKWILGSNCTVNLTQVKSRKAFWAWTGNTYRLQLKMYSFRSFFSRIVSTLEMARQYRIND